MEDELRAITTKMNEANDDAAQVRRRLNELRLQVAETLDRRQQLDSDLLQVSKAITRQNNAVTDLDAREVGQRANEMLGMEEAMTRMDPERETMQGETNREIEERDW